MPQKSKKVKFYLKLSYGIVSFAERFYYNLGIKIALHPWKTIAICWSVVLLTSLGFLRFHQEKNPLKLWVPPNSQFVSDTNWLMQKFGNGFRMETVLIEAQDVLTPEVLIQVAKIDKQVKEAVTSDGISWDEICFRIPELDESTKFLLGYGNKDDGDDFEPSTAFNAATYCKLVESMERECFTKNLLKLWNHNQKKLNKLTKQDIINMVNTHKKDKILGNLRNYEELLGGVTKNETGHIISATALHSFYMVYVNLTDIDMDKTGNSAGTADWASDEVLKWEGAFIDVLENVSRNSQNMSIYYAAARSFGDISSATTFQDMDILIFGIGIMVLYVQFVISKFNCVEARMLLGGCGLLAIGMAFVVACGFCSLVGISYGPVHTSLPFLLMGLGVDDMFVIAACWDELVFQEKTPLEQRIGLMLKHAGISITVTTVTDVLAFLVGASTILPSLASFCLYAATGVLITFVFVVTFFIACFTLDQKRIMANRNGALVCYKHQNYKPNECSQRKISAHVFNFVYSKFILTKPVKILILIMTTVSLGFSIESALKLEQRFDPLWFIPQRTYLAKYLNQRVKYYPNIGYEGEMFLGSLNYTHEMQNIHDMVASLENSTDVLYVNSWVDPFRNFVKTNFKKDMYSEVLTPNEFNLFLSKFLFSTKGARFQANFIFSKELQCGIPAPNITISSIDFNFKRFSGPREHLPAMHKTLNIAKINNFTTGDQFATVWSKIFATWVTDEIIDSEVARNLQLALLCVMICTVLLVANLQICFWIFICVLLTMTNVVGYLQRWGVTIDLVTCIGLQLAIGLCVDYATHIGHSFLRAQESSRHERVLKAVSSIGAAVMYGGLSTFIGICMLSFSEAYVFNVFFKVFSLVVLFGMFHGVIVLPVILSFVGPSPYQPHEVVKEIDAPVEMGTLI